MNTVKIVGSLNSPIGKISGNLCPAQAITGKVAHEDYLVGTLATARRGEDSLFTGLMVNTLTEIDDNTVTSIRQYGFAYATKLRKVRLSKLTSISPNGFRWCSGLEVINLPNLTGNVGISCFASCTNLTAVILGRNATSPASLSSTSSFTGTPIASGTGYIYVPSALVDAYREATNWSTYADQIRAIEDYPEITGE